MKTKFEDFYMTPYRETSHKKRNIVLCISVLSLVLVCGGCLGWYYGRSKNNNNNEKTIKIPENKVFTHVCSDVPGEQKFDCYPDAPVNEDECVKRGCCFSVRQNRSTESSLPPLNVPECYFPSNYTGYAIKDVVETPRRLLIKLERVQRSGFVGDVSNINILVSHIDDYSLRIKITNADSQRFEVPIQLHYQTKELINPLYSVKLDTQTGLLTIVRKSTESIIFKTSLPRLIYSDQFLQLSSDLPSSYIYGIGEHYEGILRNVNWSKFTLLNSDLSPIPDHALYGSHPFYMALEKDGKANGVFLLNSNAMDIILQPTPAITFRPIGGILDFYIMVGPSPKDVTQQYSNIVGKTFMPPFWSLGFQLCRYGYNSLNVTKKTMQRTINAGIPLDVQWNDIDYMDKYKDFTYDTKSFAGLPDFVEEIHSKGMHYVLMIDPGISNSQESYNPYDEGLDDDVFVKNANGSLFIGKVWPGTTVYPDFSHPAATSYWTRQFRRLYDIIKYDGVWIDMNEPSNFFNGGPDGCPDSSFENPQYVPGGISLTKKTLCMTAKHYSSIHYNEHNLYGYREAVATYEAIKSIRKKRPFIISRANFPGQGVFSGHWSGDVFSTWEDMRYSIRSLINFNMYAIPMIGSDICGFNGNVTQELCARWQALGAFYPFSRNHNEIDTIEQDPVALGPIVVEATAIALQKRYTLLPYFYTLFYRSHVFGDTVIRPLFFEFPDDKSTYAIDEQFLWGSSLMIVQVLYPNTNSVEAYFPKGLWYDAVTGQQTNSSGENITLNIPITDIHLSVRGGVILPSLIPNVTTTETRKNPFAIAVALDGEQNAFGELYWDDGDSLDTYDNEYYNLIQFQASKGMLKSTIIKSGYQTNMPLTSVNIIGYDKFPTEVMLNDHNCTYSSPSVPMNSTIDNEDFTQNAEPLNRGILGIGIVKNNLTEEDEFCKFFQLGPMLVIQPKSASLLSPLSIIWQS